MKIETLIQGSDAWLQFRADHFGASEAAAMLGLSTKTKRTELLHIKHTGNAKEFNDWVQKNILDYGHEVEAAARPLVEELIGDELYPVTCSNGKLSASCDGLTMDEGTAFEHKQWNEVLAAAVRAGELPDEYMPQCQQVLMVTKASKLIFVCSNGTLEKFVSLEVLPDVTWFKRITAGWVQFEIDLAEYTPKLLAEKPEADAIKNLPALAIQIRGEVLASNLPAFKEAADAFIANINTDLQTDEDFANAEATVKYCGTVEDNLELTKRAVIAQTATIEDVMITIDQVKEQIRSKRLTLEKAIKSEKEAIRETILSGAKLAYAEHLAALEAEIKPIRLAYLQPDFSGAMKSKRTLTSLHDAVDTLLANAKIETGEMATDIRNKLAWCKTNAEGYGFLFMDMQQIIQKPTEDFHLIIKTRVADHQRAEAEKAEQLRAKIAEEERVKAEKAAAEKAAAEQAAIAEKERKDASEMLVLQKKNAIAGGANPEVINKGESMLADVVPTKISASRHSPVPERTAPQITGHTLKTSDREIIDVVTDIFSWTDAEAIDRLEKIDFVAARSNLVATAA